MRAPTARQRRKQWAADRKELAAKWFDGDETFAQEFLESLPYSAIPEWNDAEYVMETLANRPLTPKEKTS
jgi:hypothetical protein